MPTLQEAVTGGCFLPRMIEVFNACRCDLHIWKIDRRFFELVIEVDLSFTAEKKYHKKEDIARVSNELAEGLKGVR